MDGIAASHETTLEAVALSWLRQNPLVTSIITGVKNIAQLNANLAAVDITLTDGEIASLNEIGAIATEYPGWMLAQGSAGREALLTSGAMLKGH